MQEYHYVEYVSFKKISDEKQNSGFPKKTLKFLAIFRRHLGPVGRNKFPIIRQYTWIL